LEKSRDDISEKLKELTGDWTEDENDDDADDKPATTELASELATKHSESTAHEEEEDDIDLALESLHKGPEDQAVEKTGEEYVTSAEDAVVPAASMNNQPEKMDVDSETADEKAPKSVVEIKKEDEIENDEEEFIKEDAPIADAEPGVELSEAVAPAEIDDDVHLEADNIRKELLDELIAEAEKPNQEKSVVQPEENATTEALAPALDSAVTEEDDLVPATQLSTDQMEVDDPEAEKPAKNNDDARTTDKKETAEDKPNKSGDVAEKATTESAKAAEGTTSGEAASVDKVKSLISEWGDDDENEDENGVSAAAKEEL